MLVELVELPLVALASEIACIANSEIARELKAVLHLATERLALEGTGRLLEPTLFLVEDAHVLDVAQHLPVRERQFHDRLDGRRQVRTASPNFFEELEKRLLLVLTFEAGQRRFEIPLDRLVLRLELGDDDRRLVVVAVREVDDGLQNLGLGIERFGKVRSLDRVDVAEGVRKVASHEVRPRLLEQTIEPILATYVHLVPIFHGGRELGAVDAGRVVFVELDARRIIRAGHREKSEIAHARFVFESFDSLIDRGDHALESLYGRNGLA